MTRSANNDVLRFRNAEAALEYACKYLTCKWEPEALLPGVVLEASERGSDGIQDLVVKVASDEGGVRVPYCMTLNEDVPTVAERDLVAFWLREQNPLLGNFGTIGFVIAKLEPEFDVQNGWKTAWSVTGSKVVEIKPISENALFEKNANLDSTEIEEKAKRIAKTLESKKRDTQDLKHPINGDVSFDPKPQNDEAASTEAKAEISRSIQPKSPEKEGSEALEPEVAEAANPFTKSDEQRRNKAPASQSESAVPMAVPVDKRAQAHWLGYLFLLVILVSLVYAWAN